MIIWSGLGILIPVIAVIGVVVGTLLASAVGQTHLGVGFGLAIAAIANWGLWRMIYPKKPRILVDPETGRQVLMTPNHGLFFIPAKAWTWVLGILAVPALAISVIGGRVEDEAASRPGYKEFEAANKLIGSHSNGDIHGNSPTAREAAASFSGLMKKLNESFFTGGSKKNLMTDGNFLTYCHAGPETVVFLCHVPSLRSYKSEDTKKSLDSIAWAAANQAAEGLTGSGPRRIIIGLRGISSYGSILSGASGDDSPVKSADTHDRSVFFTAFASETPAAVE